MFLYDVYVYDKVLYFKCYLVLKWCSLFVIGNFYKCLDECIGKFYVGLMLMDYLFLLG